MKEIIVLGGKLYVQGKANNIIAKDGALYACDYEPDSNPENWRTINGAHVHIDNEGNIDGGAGGKFNGMKRGGRMQYMKGNRPQDNDKNHPYWKTPEGKAEQYFSQRMAAAEHGTFTHQDKIKSIAEAARKKALSLNSEAAGINQEIDRINRKRKYTKEDEAKVKELNKKRIEAERESTAFVNEWRKWKEENNVPEPEHFKRIVINL